MKYKLYWNQFSGSLAPMAVLEEIEIPYEKVFVDMGAGEHLKPDYLQIHPLGLLPAFRLNDGRHVFESAGICMYLADQHFESGLAPIADNPDRAFYNQWMFYLADSIYPAYGHIAHPERYSTDRSHGKAIRDAAISRQNKLWSIVEHALTDQLWLLGENFSVADIFLHMLSTWYENKNEFARLFPNVARVAALTAKRPAVQRALDLHSLQ